MSAPSKQAIAGGIDARLAAYATLAGVALAGAAAAKADLIYSGGVNVNLPSTTAGIYINLVTGVIGTNPASVPGWDINPLGSATLRSQHRSVLDGSMTLNSDGPVPSPGQRTLRVELPSSRERILATRLFQKPSTMALRSASWLRVPSASVRGASAGGAKSESGGNDQPEFFQP